MIFNQLKTNIGVADFGKQSSHHLNICVVSVLTHAVCTAIYICCLVSMS